MSYEAWTQTQNIDMMLYGYRDITNPKNIGYEDTKIRRRKYECIYACHIFNAHQNL